MSTNPHDYRFLPVLASHNFNGEIPKKLIMSLSGQRKGYNAEEWVNSPDKRQELCMNALEIERYIMSRITNFINEDVVELAVDEDNIRNDSDSPHGQSSKHRSDDYIDFNVFFPTEKGQTSTPVSRRSSPSQSGNKPRTMRISQSRLVQNIALISVCTTDGPAYPTNYVKKSIASAALKPR